MRKKQQIDMSNVIFNDLKKKLINLSIKPGEVVVESEICDMYKVTRPPVRTALKRLSDIGLVDIIPYKGITAPLIDLDQIYQIIHMRIILENQVIQDFIDSKPDNFVIEEMEHNLRLQKIIAGQSPVDETDYFKKDSELHEIWFRKTHCEHIWKNIQMQQIEYTRFRMLDFVVTCKYNEIIDDHEELIRTIVKSDKKSILPIIGRHLNNGLRRMGDLIYTDYRQYFKLSENRSFWQQYNKKYFL
jgi:DNA-binding GntR family transcriptional regulator